MRRKSFDVAVIGGGLTGCAVARDAAGRGMSVYLCDSGDLASGASSSALPLVHGGIRHIADGNFSALRRSLKERARVAASAPHLVRQQRFLLPHHQRMWPLWALGGGLWAYGRLARSDLPRGRRIAFAEDDNKGLLERHFTDAFEIHDYVADGARLTIANALDARIRGAHIDTHTQCVVAEREGVAWRLSLESMRNGDRFAIKAKAVVNATGIAAADTAAHVIHGGGQPIGVSHYRSRAIYILRRAQETDGYILPFGDGQIAYAIPRPGKLLMIAAGPVPYRGDPANAALTVREIAELCDVASQYFAEPVLPSNVGHSEASVGVLPSNHDPLDQDFAVVADVMPRVAPAFTAFGGSLTSYRLLAEKTVDPIARGLKAGRGWTAVAPLPGGAAAGKGVPELAAALSKAYPFLGSRHAEKLISRHGTLAADFLSGARRREELGTWFGDYLTEREVAYMCAEEWASSAEDILLRRTRLGLTMTPDRAAALAAWFEAREELRKAA